MKNRNQCKDDNEYVEQFIGSNANLPDGVYVITRPIMVNCKLTGDKK
jgi:hypothetical protein